jgi:predicted nucleic acid-binding protein
MSGDRTFIDTNVIVYAYDRSAGEKHLTAAVLMAKLWDSGLGLISTQVLQEFYVTVTSKIPKPLDPVSGGEIISDLLKWDTVVNNGEAILDAISIQSESGLSFWDSMIITAAVSGGAALLYTEDLNDGQVIRGVEIRNPFKSSDS